MRVAAPILTTLALLPALAAAQSSPYPAARQGAATGSGATSESRAGNEGDGHGQDLVVDCPSRSDDGWASPRGVDSDSTAALKVQTSHLQQTTRPTMNRIDAQVSFVF